MTLHVGGLMILAIEAYFAALENPNAIEYYSEVIEGMSPHSRLSEVFSMSHYLSDRPPDGD